MSRSLLWWRDRCDGLGDLTHGKPNSGIALIRFKGSGTADITCRAEDDDFVKLG